MTNTSNISVINPLHCERVAIGRFVVMYGTLHIGEIEAQDDGFYAFYPKTTGYWTPYQLRNVADLLDNMNRS